MHIIRDALVIIRDALVIIGAMALSGCVALALLALLSERAERRALERAERDLMEAWVAEHPDLARAIRDALEREG